MAGLPPFLKRQNDYQIIFCGKGELVFYVPEKYFETDKAVVMGEDVELLGIFDYALFDDNGKPTSKLKPFKLPSALITRPYAIDKIKDVKLTENTDKGDYRLLKYKNGDKVIVSTKIAQDITNVEVFYNMFIGGMLPNTIPYQDIWKYVLENGYINGLDTGITTQLLGVAYSELCRDPKDPYTPFRLTDMKDPTAYRFMKIQKVPKYISPYASITSENWGEAIVHGITDTQEKRIKSTPMEKIMLP